MSITIQTLLALPTIPVPRVGRCAKAMVAADAKAKVAQLALVTKKINEGAAE